MDLILRIRKLSFYKSNLGVEVLSSLSLHSRERGENLFTKSCFLVLKNKLNSIEQLI